jgi:DNA primase
LTFEDSGQRAFSDAGQPYQFIQPLGHEHPIEIATSRVLAGGTLNLTIRELWNGWVWQQLSGLAGTNNIVDIFKLLARDPSYVTAQTVIKPPGGGRTRGKNFHNCYHGSVRYLTMDGTKTLAETAGTTQMVMGHRGNWTPAEIREFGEQEMYSVIMTRHGTKKELRATAEHRWFKQTRKRPQFCYATEVLTTDLQPGDRLTAVYRPNRTGMVSMSPQGIQAGVVFGDGNLEGKARDTAGVSMWDEKEQDLLTWFPLNHTRSVKTNDGRPGTRVVDLPKMFKTLPSMDIGLGFLYGWLAGYMATDGHVSKEGHVSISSSTRENLNHVRDVCHLLGIRTWGIIEKFSEGYGGKGWSYLVTLRSSDLPNEFFLREKHRVRAAQRQDSVRDMDSWVVESVEPTGEIESSYCAVVPDGHSFVLEDNILTGNCVVVDISDNDTITVGALAVTKGIVCAYTHWTAL